MDKKALEDRDGVVLLSQNATADVTDACLIIRTSTKSFQIILQIKSFKEFPQEWIKDAPPYNSMSSETLWKLLLVRNSKNIF